MVLEMAYYVDEQRCTAGRYDLKSRVSQQEVGANEITVSTAKLTNNRSFVSLVYYTEVEQG